MTVMIIGQPYIARKVIRRHTLILSPSTATHHQPESSPRDGYPPLAAASVHSYERYVCIYIGMSTCAYYIIELHVFVYYLHFIESHVFIFLCDYRNEQFF